MATMKSFSSFNVRQLQVYAGLCLWKYCNHFGIRHPLINALIIHLIRMITASNLTKWEHDGASLAISGRGDPLPEDVSKLFTPDALARFNVLVESCVEVGIIDMYGASTKQPMNFLQRSIDILLSCGISLPPADVLETCKNGMNSWGEPVSDLELKKILDAYGAGELI